MSENQKQSSSIARSKKAPFHPGLKVAVLLEESRGSASRITLRDRASTTRSEGPASGVFRDRQPSAREPARRSNDIETAGWRALIRQESAEAEALPEHITQAP
jgi:hypothetical protein